MKILSWNCRGLGNPRSVRALRQMVREEAPKILFLSETKSDKTRMEYIKQHVGFANGVYVESEGRSGGLGLLWKEGLVISLRSFSKNNIDAVVEESANKGWRITDFYSHPETPQRADSWNLLRCLKGQIDLPWLCLGDFNEIVCSSEKLDMNNRADSQMMEFRRVLDECEFKDLGFYGQKFTWSNRRNDGANVKERLDRAIANIRWCHMFRQAKVFHLISSMSDHSPICVNLYCRRSKMQ
uniref:Endonuclease/exonuclease/phosphatase domain-containing protein n=1 Tax=Davidia involucrata TaxID=16924 RepID=A0A5B7A8Z2_DAVIN